MTEAFTEDYAILTGGPSLKLCWNDSLFSKFHSVWAINMTGKEFRHHYCFYLDTPDRIFGEPNRKLWPKTERGFMDRQLQPIDPECSITFPACFKHIVDHTREGSKIYIYGWDCAGDGVVDGQKWKKSRNECERRLMKKYWNPEKVAGVFGGMQEWAEEELGVTPRAEAAGTPLSRNRAEAQRVFV